MKKFYYLTRAIFEDEIREDEKEKIIYEIQSCKLLNDLIPYLIHHKLLCHFYALIVNYNLITYMDKESWRLITKNVIYEQLKSSNYGYELEKICQGLDERNIRYAILKGFHLKTFLYEKSDNLIRRIFNDIDILVEKKEIKCVNELLESMGYFKGEYDPETNSLRRYSRKEEVQFLMTSHQSAQYIKPSVFGSTCINDVFIVDVNFSIFEGGNVPDPISTKYLLECSVEQRGSAPFFYYSLNLEHDFFQLFYHLYKDSKYEIKKTNNEQFLLCNLIDIYRYIKLNGGKINWNYVSEMLEKANVKKEFKDLIKLLNEWTASSLVNEIYLKFE